MFGSVIREATAQDYPTFLKLWISFLENQLLMGGDVLPTPKTISFFTVVFNAYITGERRGVVLLAGDYGVSLWGEDMGESPIDCKYVPLARGWGIYVTPEYRRKGLSTQLYEYGARRMAEMGFSYVCGMILINNDVSLQGLAKYETQTPSVLHIKALGDV